MEFRQILKHSLYEINKFGDVRKCTTQKVMNPVDGNIRIVTDKGKRTMRSIERLVQETFFPEMGKEANCLRFVSGIGYIVDKAGFNTDEALLGKLVSYKCDYKIKAQKNYKNEIRFQFMGLLKEDKDVKCLLFNEDNETTTLFNNEDEAKANQKTDDEMYYFCMNEGKNNLNNVDLLEHVLNAKFYYIKSKLDECDTEVDEAMLYKQYLSYDFESRYDEYCEELSLPMRDDYVNRSVKVAEKGICGLDLTISEDERDDYEKQRNIDLAKKHERSRIIEDKRLQKEQQERNMLLLNGDNIIRAVEGETKKALKRYNVFFGTNFSDIEAFVKDHKMKKRVKEHRDSTAMRQKEKDAKMKKKLMLKMNELD